MMNGHGKSDSPIVPEKFPNKGEGKPFLGGGNGGKGAGRGQDASLNQGSDAGAESALSSAKKRLREAAEKDRKLRIVHPYPDQRIRVMT